jgi:hypothetical protein
VVKFFDRSMYALSWISTGGRGARPGARRWYPMLPTLMVLLDRSSACCCQE